MPDLTRVTMARCCSLDGVHYVPSSDRSKVYTVSVEGWECRCDCPASRYGKRDEFCKHIVALREENCTWHQLIDGGSAEDGKCPLCGGPVEYFAADV